EVDGGEHVAGEADPGDRVAAGRRLFGRAVVLGVDGEATAGHQVAVHQDAVAGLAAVPDGHRGVLVLADVERVVPDHAVAGALGLVPVDVPVRGLRGEGVEVVVRDGEVVAGAVHPGLGGPAEHAVVDPLTCVEPGGQLAALVPQAGMGGVRAVQGVVLDRGAGPGVDVDHAAAVGAAGVVADQAVADHHVAGPDLDASGDLPAVDHQAVLDRHVPAGDHPAECRGRRPAGVTRPGPATGGPVGPDLLPA